MKPDHSERATGPTQNWWQTAPGAWLLEWERSCFADAVTDAFGYHALQLGMPLLDTLAANRMPQRWLALEDPLETVLPAEAEASAPPGGLRAALCSHFAALPFAEASLDLVTLPHTLEWHEDPHATLREVERVLVHEGRVVLSGLNPHSLWGARDWVARLHGGAYLPDAAQWLTPGRVADWLRLLGLTVESQHHGCYEAAARSSRWLDRTRWLHSCGARFWPIFGAGWVIVAVKRARGARLLGPAWKNTRTPATAPVSIAQRDQR